MTTAIVTGGRRLGNPLEELNENPKSGL